MKRLPRGYKAQIVGTRMLQTMYTAEQMRKFAQRTWVGLTDEEKAELDAEYGDDTLAHLDAIEAKLREKNNG